MWINHVGNCIRTKSPFADWSTDNYNRQNKRSAPTVNKKPQKYNKGGFTHPVGEVGPASEETLDMCQNCINKGG